MRYFGLTHPFAGMAELADAADSKSAEGNLVGVRPPLPAPNYLKFLKLTGLESGSHLVSMGQDPVWISTDEVVLHLPVFCVLWFAFEQGVEAGHDDQGENG
jgi:hypothetical protein